MWNPFARRGGGPGEPVIAAATFVIGIGVMAIEITASRLLAPYFGASMFVWTSLIVTVLVALSVGYFFGGRFASRGAGLEIVGFLSCGAAALLVFGMLVIPSFSTAVSGLLVGLSTASIALFLGSLVVTMIVFACPVFLMAMSGPILLKAWSAHGDVGAISGRYFAISTIGSVIGTVAPTLVLVPTIGARGTIYAISGMFLLLGLILAVKWRKLALTMTLALALVPLALPHVPKDVVMERESPYQLIRVAQDGDRRYLIFNEGSGIQSVYVPGHERTGFYYDYLGLLPLMHPKATGETHRGLIIGLAGGTAAVRYPSMVSDAARIELTGVEVDPAVIDTARRWFALDETGVRVVNADGRVYLQTTRENYDSILVDAYSTQLYIPPHLATKEFYTLAKTRLAAGGVLAMNVNAPSDESRLLRALTATAASVFGHVIVVPVSGSWNHLVLASDEPFDIEAAARRVPEDYGDIRESLLASSVVPHDPAAEVFTDDRAPVEFLTDSMIVAQAFGHAK
ncbi:MAG TPA: fused MFS/spermidine synthase [Candidatus Eisenbacteria bacterium]|nr:fused MFS/spermidine synthase [Candidatus Eisenbacteria bacterium]